MNHPETYRGQQVVVLGLAKSGVQVAKVLHRAGASVTVNDKKKENSVPKLPNWRLWEFLLYAVDTRLTSFMIR